MKNIKRILDIGNNNFLVQSMRMTEFNDKGKHSSSELYWSMLSGGQIIEVSPTLLEFLVSQEH